MGYDMGNAGDMIKHGLIAEFCEWWFETRSSLVFADSFGGSPWGDYQKVQDRIAKLGESTALGSFYKEGGVVLPPEVVSAVLAAGSFYKEGGVVLAHDKSPKYVCSAHLVKEMAKRLDKNGDVYAFDRCGKTYSELKHSGLKMMILPYCDGYRIFDKQDRQKRVFNLILIDPYGNFLLDEHHHGNAIFNRICQHVGKYENVYVALFVLDMMDDNDVHKNFDDFKASELRNMFVSLRCPKINYAGIKGESRYNSEIMLISKQFAINQDGTEGLKMRLRKFAKNAGHALGGVQVKFLPEEQK